MKKIFFILLSLVSSFLFSQTRTDTVMFTYYDLPETHPRKIIYYDPGYGIHVIGEVMPFRLPSDRNIYYNFFDERLNLWIYGQQGIPIFPFPASFGELDINPNTHNAYCIAHFFNQNYCLAISCPTLPIEPCTIRIANYDFLRANLAITNNGWFHIICSKGQAGSQYYDVCYIRMREWGNPEEPRLIAPRHGEPIACSNYGIFASKRSNKIVVFWSEIETSGNDSGGYRISYDGGDSWSEVFPLPFPEIFTPGSETLPEISFIQGFFDREDNPNFVICYTPKINGSKMALPVEIWHYNPMRQPTLTRICRVSADTLYGEVEFSSFLAGRPTIGEEERNRFLYVIWEQYDPLNYEPLTRRLRADIWVSFSTDNGLTWSQSQRITTPDQTSKKYPCLSPIIDQDNNLYLSYLQDLIAGIYVQGEDSGSYNPIIVKKVRLFPAVEENKVLKKDKEANFLGYDITGKIIRKEFLKKGIYFLFEKERIKKKVIFK